MLLCWNGVWGRCEWVRCFRLLCIRRVRLKVDHAAERVGSLPTVEPRFS